MRPPPSNRKEEGRRMPKLACQLECGQDFAEGSEGVLCADQFQEAGALHDQDGLAVYAAEDKTCAVLLQNAMHVFERMKGCGVEVQDMCHLQDQYFRIMSGS